MPLARAEMDRRRFLATLSATAGVIGVDASSGPPAQSTAPTSPGAPRTVAGLQLRWCPSGTFLMGSPASEPGRRADEQQVAVRLTRGFWMSAHEVTQGQWQDAMGDWPGKPPTAQFGLGREFPMYWVNYGQAEAFCAARTTQARIANELPSGWRFRLPTEAQWEYACRAGTTGPSAFGDTLTSAVANLRDDAAAARGAPSIGRACQVGQYRPNPWGLHDMHGNVFEWCRDWYHARLPGGDDPDLSAVPGVRNRDGTFSRVRRGGAWNDAAVFCRSALRLRYEPERDSDHIGFRVVLVEG